jgi:hypothetical protein
VNIEIVMPDSHFDGSNMWILKPAGLNRGRGIHVFNDLKTLNKLVKEYTRNQTEGKQYGHLTKELSNVYGCDPHEIE